MDFTVTCNYVKNLNLLPYHTVTVNRPNQQHDYESSDKARRKSNSMLCKAGLG